MCYETCSLTFLHLQRLFRYPDMLSHYVGLYCIGQHHSLPSLPKHLAWPVPLKATIQSYASFPNPPPILIHLTADGWSKGSDKSLTQAYPGCISLWTHRGNMSLRHTLQQVRPCLRLRGLKDSLIFITRFPSILSSQGRSVLSAGAFLQGSPVPVIHPLSPLISAKASAMSCLVTRFVPVGPAAVTQGLF